MRRRTPVALLSATALLVGLTGCFVATPPPPPTGEEAYEQYEMMLDRSWQSTGLAGLLDRPAVTSVAPVALDGWAEVIRRCMLSRGRDAGDFELDVERGFALTATVTSDVRFDFYLCLAENPASSIGDSALLSRAQLDYIYDYYVEWLVPCLQHGGYEVSGAPTRDEFIDAEGAWSPYDEVTVADVADRADFAIVRDRCGPERPSLD